MGCRHWQVPRHPITWTWRLHCACQPWRLPLRFLGHSPCQGDHRISHFVEHHLQRRIGKHPQALAKWQHLHQMCTAHYFAFSACPSVLPSTGVLCILCIHLFAALMLSCSYGRAFSACPALFMYVWSCVSIFLDGHTLTCFLQDIGDHAQVLT